ncbi:hypothetical protein [Leptospira kirschneri]|uniref:Uncharacterized protein n=1 Tax=Leptospira kirschneri serovar Bulgarica str. Nikolaevo TaxID=1240687 RepID=M6FFX7_9LEPT|nr:hypothetical protein [Leptospira kirschneri]EKO61646.1 hypothetical protein LEP1GSC082_4039 [Leptospira kirschneri str. H2]EMK21741.1 hypothetical protein LEP1GSC008_3286 [Leptospira kirschneri serovar Bulgarica str. Nikolaevo]UML82297.1 hypothetical protein FH602_10240 [Leptospira kirschneri]
MEFCIKNPESIFTVVPKDFEEIRERLPFRKQKEVAAAFNKEAKAETLKKGGILENAKRNFRFGRRVSFGDSAGLDFCEMRWRGCFL